MKRANRNCPICKTMQVEVLHTQRFELHVGHPLSNGYDVVTCQACGFVYADTTATQADYDHFYIELSKYEDHKTATGGGENPLDRDRLEITAHQIAAFLSDTSTKILDVGCANGGMLRSLKNLGFQNLCGLDPSRVCVDNTRSIGIEAYTGSLFKPFHISNFDCVILSHTLEHVLDIQRAMEWIKARLDPNGKQLVYVEVPDATRYVNYLYAPFQDFNTEHINHFSPTGLKNALGLAGFESCDAGEKNLALGPSMFYPSIYGFWRKSPPGSTFKLVPDKVLYKRVSEYIHQSQVFLNAIDIHLQRVLSQKRQIIVWGTGQLAMKLLVDSSLGKADITIFVDNNPINQGKTLFGKKIISPRELVRFDGPILITTLLYQQDIAAQIKQMGLPNDIIFLRE